MNRKQLERANDKYGKGLRKRLLETPFDCWDMVLDEALHHIAKTNLSNVEKPHG